MVAAILHVCSCFSLVVVQFLSQLSQMTGELRQLPDPDTFDSTVRDSVRFLPVRLPQSVLITIKFSLLGVFHTFLPV